MADTQKSIPIEIRHRWEDRIIYRSETAKSIACAIIEAAESGANLYGANLCDANLCRSNLRGANLRSANLCGADLYGANLCGANLRGADLYGANLCGANLCGADLCDANLCGAKLYGARLRDAEITATAVVAFTGHGQCGRQLLAVRAGDSVLLWCGCFHGTPEDLRAYIAGDEPRYRKTRTIALDTVLALLDATNDE